MSKQLSVNLAFTANTRAAKTEMEALKRSLLELANSTALKTPNFELTSEIQEAARAAAQLQVQLEQATNVNTGQLDLTKFNDSLKKSGMSLTQYQNQLYQLGPAGEKAFVNLTRAITTAEVPLRRSGKLMTELWTTLKNTAKWQLSSSLIHGFMGALQSAYGYAQDLNGSLNDIRIVTGYSSERMAQFAKEANKAAKSLSTTTNEYTKASLIFYQQGLTDNQVAERTNITIKMANVAGDTAEKVSDQLTAVWNNFYDGTKSLEYYADAMTALGAATASSTDEIADGLEKFAAIAENVGLSYEYAAAALATVTATTRQSADVVGTAFKTLFARLEDLELGKTLEDGTSLGKYSAALNAVGVNIKDTNGQLKNMDTILNELGAKWSGLSKDTQIALAETVAGTRQYTQLMALMNNWEYFKQNLGVVETSEGTLDKQAEIYAESWEAASKRVTASAEAIYGALLKDDFFINLTNKFADLLDGVKIFINSLGGVKGLLLALGSIVTNLFSKQIGQSLSNFAHNIKMMLPGAEKAALQQKQVANAKLIDAYKDSGDPNAAVYTALAKNQMSYINNAQRMSEEEKQINQILMDRNRLMADEAVKANELLQQVKERILEERKSLQVAAQVEAGKNPKSKVHGNPQQLVKSVEKQQVQVEKLTKSYSLLDTMASKLNVAKNVKKGTTEFDLLKTSVEDVFKEFAELDTLNTDADFQKLAQALGVTEQQVKDMINALNSAGDTSQLELAISDLSVVAGSQSTVAIAKLRSALINCTGDVDKADAMMEDYLNTIREFGPKSVEASNALSKLNNVIKTQNDQMDKTQAKPISLGESFTKAASAVMALGQAMTTVTGIIDVFNDEEATTGDKILALVSGIGMLIPAIMAIAPAFSTASVGATLFGTTATAAGTAASLAMWQVTLIVMAITAIVAVVAALVTQESAAEKQAKAAAKAAEEMSEAAEEAAQSLEDIKAAFDAYDTAVAKLEECTKGTEEWNKALAEVNKTVLKILQDVPELAANANLFVRDLETGMLKINEAERENVLNAAETHANMTAAMSVVANAQSKKANVNLMKDDMGKSLGHSRAVGQAHSYGQSSVVYDDYLDFGKILTDNAKELAGLTETEYRQKVTELLTNAANDQAKSYRGFDAQIDTLVDSAVGYQAQINTLATNTEMAAQQMRTAFELLADQQLGNDYDAAEKSMASHALEARTDELTKAFEDLMTSNAGQQKAQDAKEKLGYTGALGISKAGNSDNEIYRYIAQQMEHYNTGYSFATGNTVLGADDNRRFIFTDKNGERSEEKSAKWVAQTLGAAKALEELQGNAEDASKTLDTMDANIAKWNFGGSEAQDVQEEALRGFIANGNFEGHTMGDFDTFYRAVAQGNPNGQSTGSASKEDVSWYVDKMFDDGQDGMISDDTAKKYGYETGQEMIDAFYEKLNSMSEAWESIELPDDLFGVKGLELATASKLDGIFKNINLGPQGEKAGQAFKDGLNKILEDVDPEKQTEALTALSNVDWTSWDALNQADAIMKEFGVDIDQSSEYWQNFASQMRIATGAIPDYSNLKINLNEISAILQDLDFGSLIDEEDYQRLIAYNNEWEKFFQLQADGTRRFIGSSDDMLQQTRDDINKRRQDLQKRLDTQTRFANVNWGHRDENGKWVQSDWENKTGNEIGTAKNLLNANGATQDMLNILGYDDKTLQNIISKAEAGNEDAKKQLEEMYQRIANFQKEDLGTQQTELNEMMASTATSIEELKKMQKEGLIGSKWGKNDEVTAYEKQLKYLTTTAITGAESLEELREAWAQAIHEGVDDDAAVLESYNNQLEKLTIENINGANSFKELSKAWEQADADGINKNPEVLEAYNDQLEKLTIDNINGAESFKELEKAWKKAIADNQHTDPEVIEAYDEALEKLTISNISGANSFKELEKAWNKAKDDDLSEDEEVIEVYTEALTRLNAQSLENASSYEELDEAWKKAIADGVSKDESVIEAKATGLENIARNSLGAAESLEEFDDAWDEAQERGANVTTKDYTENLIRLGEACSTATEELEKYQEAVKNGGNTAAAETMLRNAIKLGDTAEEFGVNAEELETLTRDLMDQSNLGFDAALTAATAYLKRAEEFGMTAQELRDTLSTLMLSFDELSTTEADELFKDIAAAAEEAGVSIGELVETMTDIGKRFGLTGESALEMATIFTEAASEYNISTEELAIQAQNIAKSYGLSVKAAAKLAVQNQRMNSGVAALVENWEEWKETLTTSDATSTEYANALSELQTVVRDLVGAGDDFVMTSEFMEANMGLIERAASGDEQAINQLGVAAAGATLSMLQLDEALTESIEEAAKSEDIDSPFEHIKNDFLTNKAIVQNGITELMNAVAAGTVNVGDAMSFLGDDWISALNEMALQTGMSVEEMNSLLGQMGVDADVTVTDVPTKVKVPKYRTEEKIISDGSDGGPRITETQTSIIGYSDMDGVIQVASINADSKVTYTGNGKVSSSSKSTGGGGKSAPERKEHRKADTRYKQQDDIIDDLDEKITDKEREIDKLTGEAKAQALEELEALRAQKKAAIDEKARMASNYMSEEDEGAMKSAYAALGLGGSLEIENGNVTNIESALLAGNDKYNQLVDAYNTARDAYAANDTAANQKALEAAEKALNDYEGKLEEFEEAYQQYADSRELIEDLENESADLELNVNRERPEDLEFLDKLEDRYANITAAIEAAGKATEQASKAAEDLYGNGRLQAMQRVNNAITTEIGLLEQKKQQAEQYIEVEKTAMMIAFQSTGASQAFSFNADGSIANMEEVMGSLIDQYNSLVQTYNDTVTAFMASDGGITEAEQARLDEMKQNIDSFKDGMDKAKTSADNYSNTLGIIHDTTALTADKQREILANNYDIMVEALNYQLEITSARMQEIDYYLNKTSDDFYSMAEAAVLMTDKFDVMSEVLSNQQEHAGKLKEAYANGEITQAKYVEGMKSTRDAIYSELQSMQSLDKEMLNYYSNTLTKAGEELGKYTDRMSHLNSVLDHYQSLLSTIGRETDYRSMGVVLQGIADNMENSMQVAKAEYDFYQAEADKKKALIDSVPKDSAAYELYKKEWEAAEKAARDSQDKMLAATAEWASSMKTVVENEMAGFAKSLEQSMTGGTSFDEMTTAMERATSLQEEYLTATNQTYETTKMMRVAQKALDETSNTAVKNKLKGFIQETAQMQNQEKLSKFELEMQQAKYDLLVAEIALEEAQNAKSTVRLQRNADGNFGYVYTADASQVADAQQQMDDAQNALYNKGLEAANSYTEKYQQTMSEMYDTVTSLQQQFLNGEIASQEEYDRKMLEAKEYYYQKLESYSSLYQIAVSADSAIIAESWATDFADMTARTEEWMFKVDEYAANCGMSFRKWEDVVAEVEEVVGGDFNELAQKVQNITAESNALTQTITGSNGVIDSLQSELDAVSAVTDGYAKQRQSILDVIAAYEEYLKTLNNDINTEANGDMPDLTDPNGSTSTDTSTDSAEGNSTNTEEEVEIPDNSDKALGVAADIWYNGEAAGWGGGTKRRNRFQEKGVNKATQYLEEMDKEGKWYSAWKDRLSELSQFHYNAFETGGYTGSWGPEGKFAMLHQKELVLNAHDTENILAAVDMIRNILQTIDMHSMSTQLGGILSTPGFHGGDGGTLEQNVKIEASFPNVQDHNEIEEAFNNLINKASQYAYRK